VLMFDDDGSVLAFLDHSSKRFAKYCDAKQRVPAERYMRYPNAKLDDVEDNEVVAPSFARHAPGTNCPATPHLPQGTVVARVFGRALDADGKPLADTLRQEHYVEDRFHVPVEIQGALAKALADAGTERFPLADDLARLLVSHAYLGQLDVNPVGAPGGTGDLKQCEFWAQRADANGNKSSWSRIEGRSVAAGSSMGEGNDGRLWQHQVKLVWDGLIETRGRRITRLLVLARGSEQLRWGNAFQALQGGIDVARLPGGHPIDLAAEVRYGIIGEPIPGDGVELAERAKAEQLERLRQLELQQEGPFALGRPNVKDRWQKMLGKPFDLED